MLVINDIKVSIAEEQTNKQIIKGLSLEIKSGEIHVLMGPNGSGKSTLAQAMMGHPNYIIDSGTFIFDGADITQLSPDERAKKGIFLSFQYPSEIDGVGVANFLRMVYNISHHEKLTPAAFRKILVDKMELLDMKEDFMHRYVNEGFSGGEKKRMEMLQMLVAEPKLAVLDEVDSGLDIDALKHVAKAVNHLHEKNNMAVLIITHYTRILKHIEPDFVHILQDGVLVKSGGKDLAEELEEKGYAPFGE